MQQVKWQWQFPVYDPTYYLEQMPRAIDPTVAHIVLRLDLSASVDVDQVDDVTLSRVTLNWGSGNKVVSPDFEVSYQDEFTIQDYLASPEVREHALAALHLSGEAA